ncbi:MAG: hypothetical protein ACREOZ_01010 [Gloeomargaritales cyanobacterium]
MCLYKFSNYEDYVAHISSAHSGRRPATSVAAHLPTDRTSSGDAFVMSDRQLSTSPTTRPSPTATSGHTSPKGSLNGSHDGSILLYWTSPDGDSTSKSNSAIMMDDSSAMVFTSSSGSSPLNCDGTNYCYDGDEDRSQDDDINASSDENEVGSGSNGDEDEDGSQESGYDVLDNVNKSYCDVVIGTDDDRNKKDYGTEFYEYDEDESCEEDENDELSVTLSTLDRNIADDDGTTLSEIEDYDYTTPGSATKHSVFNDINQSSLHQSEEDLLILIKNRELPPSLFKEIMNWAKEASDNKYAFQSPTYKTCMSRMIAAYDEFSGGGPEELRMQIPGNNHHPIHVYRNSFLRHAERMLSDRCLMEDSIWSHDDESGCYADINTGTMWRDAECHVAHLMDRQHLPEDHYICPILLFDDSTICDGIGRLTAQPLLFSLGNICTRIRRNSNAWTLLGIIPSYPKTQEERSRDRNKQSSETEYLKFYHQALDIILNGARLLCEQIDGVKMHVHGKGSIFLHFELFMIIGGTDGHNKMVCHYWDYSGHSSDLPRC